jgi:predicted flap endonuclease-1-like 5' DNA nuclease
MIDAQPSLEAARKVSLSQLVEYLRATGWKQLTPEKELPIFSIDFPGADDTIFVPLSGGDGARDERQRIADALQTLAALEERDISEIAQEIEKRSSPDRLRARPAQSTARSAATSAELSFDAGRPISDIDGLSAFAASKFKSLGISTTDALLEAARTVKGRKVLSAKTGIDEQQLLEWANFSDYMRIPGMGKAKVGLLRAAGVTTVRELAHRNAVRLAQNMKEVNLKRKLVRVLPSEKSIEQLIEQARKLPRKISY